MVVKKRYLTPFIKKDLQSKMVFLAGPRQVGKTYYFKERTSIPKFYQVHLEGTEDYEEKGVRVLPFSVFCKDYLKI